MMVSVLSTIMFKKTFSIGVILGFVATISAAQNQMDSLESITPKDFFQRVEQYHPVLKQARLLPAMAEAEVQQARGAFDPKLQLEQRRKRYDGKAYWDDLYPSLKLPSWPGVDFKASFHEVEGEYVNPENNTSENGLVGLGVVVPVGRNLLIDARRASLKRALLMREFNEAEQLKLGNKVRLKATTSYIAWHKQYLLYQLRQEALELSRQQNAYVNSLIKVGETPGIDSLKAAVQLTRRRIDIQKALLKRRNARLRASVLLWSSKEAPAALSTGIDPPAPFEDDLSPPDAAALDTLLEAARAQHPELNKLNAKQKQLDVDRRLAVEGLKPLVDVEFTWLNGANAQPSEWSASTIDEDYKLGISVSMPVLLRKARGKLNLTQLKLLDNRYALQSARQEVEARVKTYVNEWRAYDQQLRQQRTQVNNYYRLLEAEREKFAIGESDLLLVNLRIQQWVEARQKEVNLQAKRFKARCYTLWSAGFSPFYPLVRKMDS